MKVKIIDAMSSKKLESKVNEFLEVNPNYVIKDMQIAAGYGSHVVMIQYEEE